MTSRRSYFPVALGSLCALCLVHCAPAGTVAYPTSSGAFAPIDRFSAVAGKLQVRTANNHLPGPDEPVDFDHAPFITQSRGPGGELIRYYNFDVRPTAPARMYVFYPAGGATPLAGQDSVVDSLPGDAAYNDFFRIVRVETPADYPPNGIRDLEGIKASGFRVVETAELVNRPIVPRGSVARERLDGASAALESGWYRTRRVQWFRFEETRLDADGGKSVPTSPIYVTFNKNPDVAGGGPPSGFRVEPDGVQTHNVASSLPGDLDYSPLWLVSVYDNAAFPRVTNESTVLAAPMKARNVATVNCPIVFVDSKQAAQSPREQTTRDRTSSTRLRASATH